MANSAPKASVMERLEDLWKTRELSDCAFVAGKEEKKIPVHKLLFAIASPVFYAMFFGEMAERSGEIPIPDVTSEGFEGMAEYLYTDSVKFLSVDHACEVLMAAKKYMLPFLEKKCLNYVVENTTPSNCIRLYEFGKSLYDTITASCLDLFGHQTAQVIDSEAFLDADRSTVCEFLELPEMELASELELFKRFHLWAEREAERAGKELKDLAGELSDLVGRIRFRTMTSVEFANGPGDSPLLDLGEKCAIYKCFVTHDFTTFPERLSNCENPRGKHKEATSGIFSCTFDCSALKKMKGCERVFSEQPFYVANVPWQFMIELKNNDNDYYLRICTQDEKYAVQAPSTAKMRVLNERSEELMNGHFGNRKGWIDMYNCTHVIGKWVLGCGYLIPDTINGCTSVKVEASIVQ